MFHKRSNRVWTTLLATVCLWSATAALAQARRTEEQTRKLESGLAAILREGLSRETVESQLGKLKVASGVRSVKGLDWELRVEPAGKRDAVRKAVFETRNPIAGGVLLEALGVDEPGVVSTDAQQKDRWILDLKTRMPPAAKSFEVRIYLEPGSPMREIDGRWNANPIWRASSYPVVRVEIGRP